MNTFIEIAMLFLLVVASYWISAVVHELGHAVVGLVNGWIFDMLVVGPIGVRRKEGKLSIYFEKNIVLWGGVVGVFPTKNDVDNTKILSRFLLGGPVASILMGIVFLMICFIHFNYFLLLLGLMPISMGIVCLLPLKTGISYTDGKRWRRLHNGGKDEAEEIAIFRMAVFDQLGNDEALWQKSDFEALLDADFPIYRYYGYYYLYRYYAIRDEVENKLKTFDILNDMKKDVSKSIIDNCKL